MSKDKPKKRLVSGPEYVRTYQKKATGGILGAFLEVAGGTLLLLVLIYLFFGAYQTLSGIFWTLLWSCAGFVTIGFGHSMFENALNIEPVELLRESSAKGLPDVETLVRSSDRPSSADQAELLRAAGQGNEMPAEQLLRATNRHDQ